MDKKPKGIIWDGIRFPSFDEFLTQVDSRLMVDIENDSTWSAMFRFFDSFPWKPLTPREFLEFWDNLTEEEQIVAVLEFG